MIYYVSECIDVGGLVCNGCDNCVVILTGSQNTQESSEDCRKSCDAIAECYAWVWRTDKSCELQNGNPCDKAQDGSVSGWKC